MTAPDTSRALAAADIVDEQNVKPGLAGQLDVLARQLLAERSVLEAMREAATYGASVKALIAMTHAAVDQLDAAFALVNVMQATVDMFDVGPTIEVPEDDGRPKVGPTFGSKRRAAELAANPSTSQPGASHG